MTTPKRVPLSEPGKLWWTDWYARWARPLLDHGGDADTVGKEALAALDRQHALVTAMLPAGCVFAAGSNLITDRPGPNSVTVGTLMH